MIAGLPDVSTASTMAKLAAALPHGEDMPDISKGPMVFLPLLILLLEEGVHAHARHLVRKVRYGLDLSTRQLCSTYQLWIDQSSEAAMSSKHGSASGHL